jgi:hypothetical protein
MKSAVAPSSFKTHSSSLSYSCNFPIQSFINSRAFSPPINNRSRPYPNMGNNSSHHSKAKSRRQDSTNAGNHTGPNPSNHKSPSISSQCDGHGDPPCDERRSSINFSRSSESVKRPQQEGNFDHRSTESTHTSCRRCRRNMNTPSLSKISKL